MSANAIIRMTARWAVIVLLAVATLSIGAPVLVRWLVAPRLFVSSLDAPAAEVAIVPGASVVRGQPSPVLADRANEAIELFQEGKVNAILVTGDNSASTHDEVTPVRKYLIAAGIPSRAIFLDHAGFDTYSSMYRAKAIFGVHSAIIVTQDFHLPRAVFIARALGINASGLVAPGTERSLYDYLREIPASLKAFYDLALRRQPQYLGESIPLSGDGTATW